MSGEIEEGEMNTQAIRINERTFRHGQKVTCRIFGKKITDATVSIDNRGGRTLAYLCQNVKDGATAPIMFGYYYSWLFYDSCYAKWGPDDFRVEFECIKPRDQKG